MCYELQLERIHQLTVIKHRELRPVRGPQISANLAETLCEFSVKCGIF